MSAAMKWGLSVLDWRSHAINERAEHPIGVFKAECGHLLMTVTVLHEKPYTALCEACQSRFPASTGAESIEAPTWGNVVDRSQIVAAQTRQCPILSVDHDPGRQDLTR